MIVLTILVALTFVVALYAVWGRAWLKAKTWPWSKRLFEITEPLEIALWGKSETILWSRYLQVMGALSAFLTWLGALDVTPFIALAPERYQPWFAALPFAAVILAGIVSELLRRSTSLPLAIVAVPDNAPPAVLAEVAKADAAKNEAVATIAAGSPVAPITKE